MVHPQKGAEDYRKYEEAIKSSKNINQYFFPRNSEMDLSGGSQPVEDQLLSQKMRKFLSNKKSNFVATCNSSKSSDIGFPFMCYLISWQHFFCFSTFLSDKSVCHLFLILLTWCCYCSCCCCFEVLFHHQKLD